MSALPDFQPSPVTVLWTADESAAFAKCSDCRWTGKAHRVADVKAKRRATLADREDIAYQDAANDGWYHACK
jgi:hypothetical protein